jgi:hypothetical protein
MCPPAFGARVARDVRIVSQRSAAPIPQHRCASSFAEQQPQYALLRGRGHNVGKIIMKCSPAVLIPVLVAPLVLIVAVELPVVRACVTEALPEATSYDLDDVQRQTDLLWSGTESERSIAVEEAWARFRPFFADPADEQAERVSEQIAVRIERRIFCRCAAGIVRVSFARPVEPDVK